MQKHLITIVLLFCFTNSLMSNEINEVSFTGGVSEDSVLISYNDLRKVNSKLIELKYDKEKINNLNIIISNDSIIKNNLIDLRNNDKLVYENNIKVIKKHNKTLTTVSVVSVILLAISLFK